MAHLDPGLTYREHLALLLDSAASIKAWDTRGRDLASAVASLPDHQSELLAEHLGAKKTPLRVVGKPVDNPADGYGVNGPFWNGAWTDQKLEVTAAVPPNLDQAIRAGEVVERDLRTLATYQTWVGADKLTEVGANDVGPSHLVVMEHDGHEWLIDGNHRAASLLLRGVTHAKVTKIQPRPISLDSAASKKAWDTRGRSDRPLAAGLRAALPEVDDYGSTKFILPDGTRLGHGEKAHADATRNVGVDLYEAQAEGVIRYTQNGAEAGAPITHVQAEHLVDGAAMARVPLFVDVWKGRTRASKAFDDRATADGVRAWVNGFFVRTLHRHDLDSAASIKAWDTRGRVDQAALATGDRLSALQAETGDEHALVFDAEGAQVGGIVRGQGDAVPVGDVFAWHDPAAKLQYHHSHPGETSFSVPDLTQLALRPGMAAMYAHTPAVTYKVEPVEGRREELFHAAKDVLATHAQKATEAYFDHNDRARLRRDIDASQHEALQELAELGLLRYSWRERSISLDSAASLKAWDTRGRAAEHSTVAFLSREKGDTQTSQRVLGTRDVVGITKRVFASMPGALTAMTEVNQATNPELGEGLGLTVVGEGVNVAISFWKTDEGQIVVGHDSMEMAAELQGQGIGAAFTRDAFAEYDRLGVDRIDMVANLDVGGYAWARMGYVAEEPGKLAAALEAKVGGLDLPKPARTKLLTLIDKHREDNDLPFVIASTFVGENHVGKSLLIGSEWAGRFYMKDTEKRARMDKYTARKK